ncbi:profilin [Nemania sp. FL0916]|nr:profilin [Nemania sp. FL0916]
MSWQQYIDSSLVGSGHVDQAAIVSAAGDSVWAASPDFSLKPAELRTLAGVLAALENDKLDRSPVDTAQTEGIYVAGERYVVARLDGRTIYARQGRSGICVAKTKQAIILAHHGEAQVAGNASSTTEALADYLTKVGY